MAPHDGGCSSVKAKVMVRSRSMPALSASPFVTASLPRDRTEEDASGDFEVASHASADNLGSASIGIETFFNLAVTTAISRNNNNNNNLDGDSSDEEDDGTSFFSDPHWSIKDVRTCELESSCTPSSPQSPAAVDLEHHRRNSFMSVGSGKHSSNAEPPRQERFDTSLIHEHVNETELFDGLRDVRSASTMGILRDVLVAYRFGTKGIFGVAHTTAAVCFGLGRKALELQSQTLVSLGLESAASALHFFRSGVSQVHNIARKGLESSEAQLLRVIQSGDDSLAERGGEQGDLIRLLFGDGHYREALLCIVRLLRRLGTGFEHQNPLVLAAGFRAMVRAQAIEKQDRINRRQRDLQYSFIPLICKRRVRRWDLFMRFSAAAYGPKLLRLLRAVPEDVGPSIVTLGDGVEALTGVPGHDVIHHAPETSAMYSPAHYVAVDHANENIVVVIRGTMHVADLLVDLVCEQVNFTCRTDDDTHDYIYSGRTIRERRDADIKAHANSSASLDEETSSFFDEEAEEDAVHAPVARGFRGKAHRGFLIAARNLAVQLYDIVQDALDDHPDYNLVVTGHSMGAGIATLLTLLWAQAEAFGARTNDMHAFAFGAPCSLCHELAQSPFTRQFVTAVVVGDDFVSRLSFSTVFEVQQAVNAYASRGVSLSVDEIRDVYRTIKRDAIENKLFSAGTVWLLDSDEFNMNPVEIDPRELLHSLEFSESFLTAHLPIRYLNAIANATTFVSPESLQDVQILNTRRPNPQDVS